MSATVCYVCQQPAVLKCMNPTCTNYFCPKHGDFICGSCHQNAQQKQVATVERKETQSKVAKGIVGILVAILIGFFVLCWEIVKAVFKNL